MERTAQNEKMAKGQRALCWLEVLDQLAYSAGPGSLDTLVQRFPELIVEHLPASTAMVYRAGPDGLLLRSTAGKVQPGTTDVAPHETFDVLGAEQNGGAAAGDGSLISEIFPFPAFLWSVANPGGGEAFLVVVVYESVDDVVTGEVKFLKMAVRHFEVSLGYITLIGQLENDWMELARLNDQLRIRDLELNEKTQQLESSFDRLSLTNHQLEQKSVMLNDMIEELQRTQAQLVQNEKLAAIGLLAAGVAHEVNNPASYILHNLDEMARMARRRLPKGEGQKFGQLVDDSAHGLRSIVSIVRQLKMFSRSEPEERSEVDVQQLVEAALRILNNRLRHEAIVRQDLQATHAVMASEVQIMQIIMNLVMNACQAMEEFGKEQTIITVRSRDIARNMVQIDVEDNGPGIPAEIQAKIFEPFFTTKERGVGTGLGLSIAHTITSKHGGQLWFESLPAGGTRFCLTLPGIEGVAKTESARDTEAPLPEAEPRFELEDVPTLTILLVDDDVRVLRANRRMLSRYYNIRTAGGGQDALLALEEDASVDAVVCDLMMPDINGYDLLERVSGLYPHLRARFVFVTGGAFTDDTRALMDGTEHPCLEKPFEVASLQNAIFSVLSPQLSG